MLTKNFVQQLTFDDFGFFFDRHIQMDKTYSLGYRVIKSENMVVFSSTLVDYTFEDKNDDNKYIEIKIYFRDFDYTLFENNVSKNDVKSQTEWRKFMFEKFGEEYISAFRRFVEDYMEERQKELNAMRFGFYDEIEAYRKSKG